MDEYTVGDLWNMHEHEMRLIHPRKYFAFQLFQTTELSK